MYLLHAQQISIRCFSRSTSRAQPPQGSPLYPMGYNEIGHGGPRSSPKQGMTSFNQQLLQFDGQ